MTDPEAAKIIDNLLALFVVGKEGVVSGDAEYECASRAFIYLLEAKRDHPEAVRNSNVIREMAKRGLIT